MKTDDVMMSALAFAAVVGLGMWYLQTKKPGAAAPSIERYVAPFMSQSSQLPQRWNAPQMFDQDQLDADLVGAAAHVFDQDELDADYR